MNAFAPSFARLRADAGKLTHLVSFALVFGYAGFLVGEILIGAWLFDASGRPVANDFISVWAAGRLSLDGDPAAAYDWEAHKAVQTLAVGHGFDGYFNWPYPPTYLFVAAALAFIAYPAAQILWMAVTLPFYAAAVRAILPRANVWLAATAFPGVLWNLVCGQNGFLTAGLLGLALAQLDRRPALAGVLIGCMSYKPQFGLLIPLALVAERRGRAFGFACATTIVLASASAATFGVDAWRAFLQSAPLTNRIILVDGGANFTELISVYGVVRWLGGAASAAWAAQLGLVALFAVTIWRAWRSDAPFDLKAALLATATLMASPYIFVYDLVVLAVPIAFLARDGFSAREACALAAGCLLILVGPMTGLPVAFSAPAIVATIIFGRLARRAGVGASTAGRLGGKWSG